MEEEDVGENNEDKYDDFQRTKRLSNKEQSAWIKNKMGVAHFFGDVVLLLVNFYVVTKATRRSMKTTRIQMSVVELGAVVAENQLSISATQRSRQNIQGLLIVDRCVDELKILVFIFR